MTQPSLPPGQPAIVHPLRPWGRWRRRGLIGVLLMLAALSFVMAVPASRVAVLTRIGRSLVASDPIRAADVIVVAVDSGGAGVLEASDLFVSGLAPRVAIFADPPTGDDLEFIRRGLPWEDAAARSRRQLATLGVTAVEQIPRAVSGTEAEGDVLPAWCEQRGFRSVILVTMPDHARRVRRVLARSAGQHLTIMVRPTRYSNFAPNSWWRTRGSTRTCIVELQKLLLDLVRHPFS